MPAIELLTLANHAEAINGLLYLSGAGWTDLVRQVPVGGTVLINHFGIAVAILVSWNETNQRHRVELRIENADGRVLATVQGEIEMGRPAGLAPGSDLRGVLAINGEVQFPGPGIYRVVANVARETRSVTFRVHDAPMVAGPQAPANPAS